MLFKRMILDSSAAWLPAVSFLMVFLVFVLAVVRALAGNRAKLDRLASLPLEEEKGGRDA